MEFTLPLYASYFWPGCTSEDINTLFIWRQISTYTVNQNFSYLSRNIFHIHYEARKYYVFIQCFYCESKHIQCDAEFLVITIDSTRSRHQALDRGSSSFSWHFPLLWAGIGSGVVRGKITVYGITNCLNWCVMIIAYAQLIIVALAYIMQSDQLRV